MLSLVFAGIAQLVEQLIRNEQAAGSSPITSSNKYTLLTEMARVYIFTY